MKILYITPFDPVHVSCGGGVRSAAMLHALKKLGDVTTVVVSDESRDSDSCSSPSVHYRTTREMYAGGLFTVYRLSRKQLLERMGVQNGDYDFVVIRYAWFWEKLGAWKLGRFYVDVDDIPEECYRTYVTSKNVKGVKRLLAWLLYVPGQHWACRKALGCWIADEAHVVLMRKWGHCFGLPNIAFGPDRDYSIQECSDVPFLLTVGSLRYHPNCLGIDRFISEYWPAIKESHPRLEYHIVGGGLPGAYNAKWSRIHGVRLLGYVENVSEEYGKALGVVAPVYTGGGTSIKVIEAAKFGCKLFASHFAARGIGPEMRQLLSIELFNTPDELSHALNLWCDMPLSARIKKRSDIMHQTKSLDDQESFDLNVSCVIKGNEE